MYVCIYISHDTQSAQISRIMKYEIMKTIYIYIYYIYISTECHKWNENVANVENCSFFR